MPLFPIAIDSDTRDYLVGAARGELRITLDTETGQYREPRFDVHQDPERYHCVTASGLGHVVSWSVGHSKSEHGIVRNLFGIIELDEGPWLWGELRADEPWTDLTGRQVQVDFAKTGPGPDDATLPVFIVR